MAQLDAIFGARLSQPQHVTRSTRQKNFTQPDHAQVLRLGQPRSVGRMLCFDSNQTADSPEVKERLAQSARLGQIHFKFRHPVVGFLGVYEHLLDAPAFLVF